jgi:hypothetical protein
MANEKSERGVLTDGDDCRRQLTVDAQTPPDVLARARLVVDDGGYFRWFVSCCPICGRTHSHGAGGRPSDQTDPRRFLGHRVRHCVLPLGGEGVKSRIGYVLTDATPDRTAGMLAEIEHRAERKAIADEVG